jgi:hypothetical protein
VDIDVGCSPIKIDITRRHRSWNENLALPHKRDVGEEDEYRGAASSSRARQRRVHGVQAGDVLQSSKPNQIYQHPNPQT